MAFWNMQLEAKAEAKEQDLREAAKDEDRRQRQEARRQGEEKDLFRERSPG